MSRKRRRLEPLEDRGPLRIMFVITYMPVGGAETLLVDLVRRLDRSRFAPELCCLKFRGPLGYVLAEEIPTFSGLLAHKYDFSVLPRLKNLMLRASCRRRRHRWHRRRQDVLGTPGRALGRRARDLFGPALDGPARPRRTAQPSAGADHRRLYRRGQAARPLPHHTRRLPRAQGPRHNQRRRRGKIPSALAGARIARGIQPSPRRTHCGNSRRPASGKTARSLSAFGPNNPP